jgi:large conductance mechanosensitive channel
MFGEFKKFVLRGNVLDLAVAVMIGTAFGNIVKSLVDDVLMPPIGLLTGNVDFSNLFVSLNGTRYPTLAAAEAAGAPLIRYGLFLNNVVGFVILAFVIFLLVRGASRIAESLKKKADEPAAAPPEASREEQLLAEIRDLLKAKP